MKYKIPQDRLDKIIFKYLDNTLKGLEKRKGKHFDVFAFPDKEYGILGWKKNGTLCVYYKLINEISDSFGLEKNDSQKLIGRWASDRLQLEINNTLKAQWFTTNVLVVDYN